MINNTEEVRDDISKYASLDGLAQSVGGKILIDTLSSDIIDSVDKFATSFSTLTHQELIAIGADIKTKLLIIRILTRAKSQHDTAKEYLAELLKS